MNWIKKMYARSLAASKFQVATETHRIQKQQQDILKEIRDCEQTAEEHYQEIRDLLESTVVSLHEVKDLCSDIASAVQDMDSTVLKSVDIKDVNKELEALNASLNEIDHIYQYNNNYEREVISSFNEYYSAPDFREKFLRLIDGLDPETVDELVKILQRQYLIKNTHDKKLNLYSFEEQKLIKDMKRELSTVYRIDDGMYCYRHWFLPVKHFEASVFIYKHGIDCIKNIDILRNKDILDVGGFIGDSILILKPLTDKRVISFEAVSANFELMKKTVAMNRLDHVILEHVALGDDTTTMEIAVSGSTSSFHTNGIVKVDDVEEVSVLTLDGYMNDKDYDIGLIKVDIEGTEQAFLRGAYETIKRFRPVLLMSIYHNADDFFNIKPIIDDWNLGYKFKIHNPTDNTVSREVLLIAEVI